MHLETYMLNNIKNIRMVESKIVWGIYKIHILGGIMPLQNTQDMEDIQSTKKEVYQSPISTIKLGFWKYVFIYMFLNK